MALDSRNKRASALGLSGPAPLVFPVADGTVAQADRQQTAWTYAGLLVGALLVIGAKRLATILASRTRSTLTATRTRTAIPALEN